jgi:hypothetical protein
MAASVLRRAVASLVVAALLVLGLGPAASATNDAERRARAGVGYLASQQRANGSIPAFSVVASTADAVTSMVAARRGDGAIHDAIRFLARRVAAGTVTSVGQRAQVVLAAVAAGKDPRAFGGADLVAGLRRTERPSGRYGAGTDVYEHALAMLALAAAGAGPSRASATWLADAQCRDGGWQNDDPPGPNDDAHCVDRTDPASDPFSSDTNTTSVALQALRAGRGSARPDVSPFRLFRALRDRRFGGWGYSWSFDTTDANSTALVIQAYAATGRPLPDGALAALEALQYRRCGAWGYSWTANGAGGFRRTPPDVGATIEAVQGELREPLPIRPARVTRPAPATDPC